MLTANQRLKIIEDLVRSGKKVPETKEEWEKLSGECEHWLKNHWEDQRFEEILNKYMFCEDKAKEMLPDYLKV